MGKRPKIPSRIYLGGGYYIRVRCTSSGDLDRTGYWRGYWHPNFNKDRGVMGTIYLNKNVSEIKLWKTYWHELFHAVNDIRAWDVKN